MLHHRTTNLTKRAMHIAEREERLTAARLVMSGYSFEWFVKYLRVYKNVLKEFNHGRMDRHFF